MSGKLQLDPSRNNFPVTLHDPCNVVRLMGVVEPQREIIRAICPQFREMEPHGVDNYCCGGGSGFAIMSGHNFQDWRFHVTGRKKLEQVLNAFADCMDASIPKYLCAPCSNCKGQFRDMLAYYDLWEKNRDPIRRLGGTGSERHDGREAGIHRMGMALTADTACAAGECEQAIALLEEGLRQRPGDFRLHYRLGICYAGGCRPHSLVHADMAAAYLREALRLAPLADVTRAAILEQAANAALHSRAVTPADAMRKAIEYYLEAAQIYQAAEMTEEWARTQFNLGNSYCELAEISGEEHWVAAVSHYELCLTLRTLASNPERHAALLENLGTAYRRLPGAIEKSIRCYRRSLAIYKGCRLPEKSAALYNNLGNAFLSLAETESEPHYARLALRHFERALRLQPDPHRRIFGITQYNLAQAYFRLAQYSDGNIGRAAACLKAAAEAFEASEEKRYLELIRRQIESLTLPA